jgi:uracil-DNA glycosylase family 4
MTKYQDHVSEWKSCTGCSLCETRKRVVFARGTLPCDILFVGEAPGVSEDILGVPFVGPAGKLLDDLIRESVRAVFEEAYLPRMAYYNIIGCIPLKDGEKIGQPPKDAIKGCSRRLAEMVEIAQPRLIVAVGQVAGREIPKMLRGEYEQRRPVQDRGGKAAPSRAAAGGVQGSRVKWVQTRKLGIETDGDHRSGNDEDSLPIVEITHPAAILRANVTSRGLMARRCVVALVDSFTAIMKGDQDA